jgi:hypothetical protein
MARIRPIKFMKEGLETESERICQELRSIRLEQPGLSAFVPLVVLPEEPPNFNPSTPLQDIYREIGKLDARRLVPFARVNKSYLESSLVVYNQLLPLIESPVTRSYIEQVIQTVHADIRRLNDLGRALRNSPH